MCDSRCSSDKAHKLFYNKSRISSASIIIRYVHKAQVTLLPPSVLDNLTKLNQITISIRIAPVPVSIRIAWVPVMTVENQLGRL